MTQILQSALADIRAGLSLHRVWIALAHEDIGDQHKRTTLGPLWLLLNYLAFAGSFIFLVHGGSAEYNYPAFVATGLFAWFYIMEVVTTSVSLFVREESFIKGTTLPLSVYVMRLFMQSLIRASYTFFGCLIILFFSGIEFSTVWLWSIVGILIMLATVPAVTVVFAFIGAFFPDSQFLVGNMMRVGMFLTPVFWTYDGTVGYRHYFYYWNPFTYYLEMLRVPVISNVVPYHAFAISIAIGVCLWVIALILLGRFRRDVVFVL